MKTIIKISLFIFIQFWILDAICQADPSRDILENALGFTEWLESQTAYFGSCKPVKKDKIYELCDKTRFNRADLKLLFSMQHVNLLKWINKKGIKTKILCDPSKGTIDRFKDRCTVEMGERVFQSVTSLHGKYSPEENTIFIRSSASQGSLIHEYLHSLQSSNQNKIFGKKYKRERNLIQQKLVKFMDEITAEIQILERHNSKNVTLIQAKLKEFMLASEMLRNFGNWQDLIDERNLFLLYIQFGKEFGAEPEDIELAKKNMGFICNNPKLKTALPFEECSQSKK